MSARAIHHIDLWVSDFATARPAWAWLLTTVGWADDFTADDACAWVHSDGTYVFMQQALSTGTYDRTATGINHLAMVVPDRATLDTLRADATAQGWSELFGERYPHAGGEQHTALYLEDRDGLEVELVVEP